MEKRVRNTIIIIVIIAIILFIIFVLYEITKFKSNKSGDLEGQLNTLGDGVVPPQPPEWPTSDDYCQFRDSDGDGLGDYCSGTCSAIEGGSADYPCRCKEIISPPLFTPTGCECVEATIPCCDSNGNGNIDDDEKRQFILDCGGEPSNQIREDATDTMGEDCSCDSFRLEAGLNEPSY